MHGMEDVKARIDRLGGTVAVATALNLPPSTVSSWKTAGRIPNWRERDVEALEQAQTEPDGRTVLCDLCDRRVDRGVVDCLAVDCPHAQREAA